MFWDCLFYWNLIDTHASYLLISFIPIFLRLPTGLSHCDSLHELQVSEWLSIILQLKHWTAAMLLFRLAPCTRMACQTLCLGPLSGNARRLTPTASTFKQCAARITSNHSMKPFGRFVFDGPGNVNVAPLSPQEYPDMDQCTANCDGDDSRWKVSAEEDIYSITADSKQQGTDSWDVRLPIKYGR